ncbi:MAG: hypothetical protein JKY09_07425 [Crocinitomicaceae bacterium]|nr:hypothetical protein [Crocinitomicaceae bacterium]
MPTSTKNEYSSRVDHEYIKVIDSLYYIDQNIIRGNNTVKGNYKIDLKKLPENRFDLDSSNWNVLHKLINEKGFPSEKIIGKSAYENASIIIHHNLRLAENQKYHALIIEAIINGEYLPANFAFWYEQYQMRVNGQTFFTTWDQDLSESNITRINKNRKAYFLKNLSSMEIKKGGRKMLSIW